MSQNCLVYPLANLQKTMEHRKFWWVNQLFQISMAIFNSKLLVYQRVLFFLGWTSVNFSYIYCFRCEQQGTGFVTSKTPKYVTLYHLFSGSNSQFCLAVIPIDIPNYTKNRLSIWRCNWSTLINVNLEMRKNHQYPHEFPRSSLIPPLQETSRWWPPSFSWASES